MRKRKNKEGRRNLHSTICLTRLLMINIYQDLLLKKELSLLQNPIMQKETNVFHFF